MTWEYFLTTKFRLWLDTRSSTDNTLRESRSAVEKSGILFQTEKAAEDTYGDVICHEASHENTVFNVTSSDPIKILTLEK